MKKEKMSRKDMDTIVLAVIAIGVATAIVCGIGLSYISLRLYPTRETVFCIFNAVMGGLLSGAALSATVDQDNKWGMRGLIALFILGITISCASFGLPRDLRPFVFSACGALWLGICGAVAIPARIIYWRRYNAAFRAYMAHSVYKMHQRQNGMASSMKLSNLRHQQAMRSIRSSIEARDFQCVGTQSQYVSTGRKGIRQIK